MKVSATPGSDQILASVTEDLVAALAEPQETIIPCFEIDDGFAAAMSPMRKQRLTVALGFAQLANTLGKQRVVLAQVRAHDQHPLEAGE